MPIAGEKTTVPIASDVVTDETDGQWDPSINSAQRNLLKPWCHIGQGICLYIYNYIYIYQRITTSVKNHLIQMGHGPGVVSLY